MMFSLISRGRGRGVHDVKWVVCTAGSKLRTNLMSDGGVAPLAGSSQSLASATRQQSGMTEKFAFARAVSRLYELTSPRFRAARP